MLRDTTALYSLDGVGSAPRRVSLNGVVISNFTNFLNSAFVALKHPLLQKLMSLGKDDDGGADRPSLQQLQYSEAELGSLSSGSSSGGSINAGRVHPTLWH
tara:strand:- start:624 stop:926 length:303 start_codon:yes stop_codon:yes gene_type:complete